MQTPKKRSTHDKIELYNRRFIGRRDVYGTYNPETGKAYVIKQPVTRDVVFEHLKGEQPYGIYLLQKDRIHCMAIDFDNNDPAVTPFCDTLCPIYKNKGYECE